MKIFILVIALVLSSAQAGARALIIKKANRVGVQRDEVSAAADRLFTAFVGCDANETGKIETIAACTSKLFVKEMSLAQVRRYSEMVIFPDRYSELFDCDQTTRRLIKVYEESKFDAVYCFESNFMQSPDRVGIMFFVKEKGEYRISKIKL